MSTNKIFKEGFLMDDEVLLKELINDSRNAKKLYKPGPYWKDKSIAAGREIRTFGLNNFRGTESGAATSYGDNAYTDTRRGHSLPHRFFLEQISKFIPLNSSFNAQIDLTLSYLKSSLLYQGHYLKGLSRVKYLLSKYNLDFDTTLCGCLSYDFFEGRKISFHYLQLLDTLDFIDSIESIKKRIFFLEIGGGFGANVHLLVELFGLKKIIYLDISPNLYVATQYLKLFYGNNVFNFCQIKEMKNIKFSDNDDLEIFCIPPQYIERIESKIDFFHNSHSFTEMPKDIVQNYANKITEILATENSIISLVTYDKYNLEKTLEPNSLPNFFNYKHLYKNEFPTLTPNRSNIHYLLTQSK